MDDPATRWIKLIDNRVANRPLIPARLQRDYFPAVLDEVEAAWSVARWEAAEAAGLQHAHWDWRNKVDSVEHGRHLLIGVEVDGEVQGLMAVLRAPRPALCDFGDLIYIDYLEVAPWNLKDVGRTPRYLGTGTALLMEAVRLSRESGLEGRIGLHSLPQAEPFYAKCEMTRVGPDVTYDNLMYFEFLSRNALSWLAALEGSP